MFKLSLKEKFNAHMHLKKNVDFVKNVVELFELLVEYRDLKIESSDELKTFYLNEILVCILFCSVYKILKSSNYFLLHDAVVL